MRNFNRLTVLLGGTLLLAAFSGAASNAWSEPGEPEAGLPPSNTPVPAQAAAPAAAPAAVDQGAGGSAHGSLVDDFENPTNTTLWGGQRFVGVDQFGTVISPNPFATTAGGFAPTSGNAGCISGTEVFQKAPVYPYCFLALELIDGGAGYGAQEPTTDVSSYSPNQGLSFSYKADVAKIPYFVRITSSSVTDGGYYDYDFTPKDTKWHTLVVYFPTVKGAPAAFAQPAWCKKVPFSAKQLGSILFGPVVQVQAKEGGFNYALCVDNVTFDVPAAPKGK